MPRYTSGAVTNAKSLHCGPYLELVSAYEKLQKKELVKLIAKHKDVFEQVRYRLPPPVTVAEIGMLNSF